MVLMEVQRLRYIIGVEGTMCVCIDIGAHEPLIFTELLTLSKYYY